MNRYLLFCFSHYYPTGGWKDYKGAYRELQDAKDAYIRAFGDYDNCQIVDTHTMRIVFENK